MRARIAVQATSPGCALNSTAAVLFIGREVVRCAWMLGEVVPRTRRSQEASDSWWHIGTLAESAHSAKHHWKVIVKMRNKWISPSVIHAELQVWSFFCWQKPRISSIYCRDRYVETGAAKSEPMTTLSRLELRGCSTHWVTATSFCLQQYGRHVGGILCCSSVCVWGGISRNTRSANNFDMRIFRFSQIIPTVVVSIKYTSKMVAYCYAQ